EGTALRVRLLGHGVQATALAALTEELSAPVEVLPRIPHREVGAQYAWADTVIVSLRNWAPFAWTVPSKLYEILATGRHITALLEGEAADVVREDALVELWRRQAAERTQTAINGSDRRWVADNDDVELLARRFLEVLEEVTGR